jgi:TonB family protein
VKNQDAALPRGDEYVATLQHPSVAFRDYDLRGATIESRPNGLPRPYTGGFTMTFHAAGPRGEWAIRCFTRDVRELARRYDAIGRFTSTTSDPAFARAELIPDEILVSGRRRPIIKMEWIRGPQLNAYVDRHHGDAAAMRSLADEVVALGTRLEATGIAHGDLQHGNILVTSVGAVRLVDYDDLYLPELSDLQFSSGLGHQNFQHPGRTSRDFGPHMDRFSLYAIYIALLALAEEPALWAAYDGGDERLLFKREDYADPENSKLFADLAKREPLSEWIDRFAAVCHGTYAEIPAPADFLAGHFDYARFVPGGPRPAPRPVPAAVVAPPEPATVTDAPEEPPAASAGLRLPSLPRFGPLPGFAALPRNFDFVTPAIIVGLLGLGGIFHNAILRFAFPPAPTAQVDAPAPAAARRAPPHPRAASAAKPPAPREAPHAHAPAAAMREPADTAPATPLPATEQARIAAPEKHVAVAPAHRAASSAALAHAAVPAHAHARAAGATASATRRHTDATTALLDAAAGDLTGTPRCPTPDAPARVLSGALPAVSKFGGAGNAGGSADVEVSLTAGGEVAGASIATSSGSADLDAAALDAARRSSYSAQLLNCSHVASSLVLHVRF